VTSRLRRWGGDFAVALAFPLTSLRRTVGAALVAAATFLLLVLSTFPTMTVQLLRADLTYLDDAVALLAGNLYATTGATGVALVFAYAVLTGVVVTDVLVRIRSVGLGSESASSLGGVAPGLVASGCASCGAGVLGLLGFAGVLAALPFHGTLLRLGGLALLVVALVRTGDPRTCRVS
jgi:hypothetical protein